MMMVCSYWLNKLHVKLKQNLNTQAKLKYKLYVKHAQAILQANLNAVFIYTQKQYTNKKAKPYACAFFVFIIFEYIPLFCHILY